MYNNIGLGLEPIAWRHAPVIWNLAKWNSVKWNETRRIGAIFACFHVVPVWQRQLGFLVSYRIDNRKCWQFTPKLTPIISRVHVRINFLFILRKSVN